MKIKPIRTDADHERALRDIERLWGAPEGSPEGDALDVLVTLVNAYEEQRWPIALPDPIDAIRFRLEQQGKDARALIGVIGTRSRVYEVMRGQRPLSLRMIRVLHDTLGIPRKCLSAAPSAAATLPDCRTEDPRRMISPHVIVIARANVPPRDPLLP